VCISESGLAQRAMRAAIGEEAMSVARERAGRSVDRAGDAYARPERTPGVSRA